jgi:hypothetical protein
VIPHEPVRKPCWARWFIHSLLRATRAHLTDAEAIKAVHDALCLIPDAMNAILADWLVPRCLRH